MPITNLYYQSRKYLYCSVLSPPLLVIQTPKSCRTTHLLVISPHYIYLIRFRRCRVKRYPPSYNPILTSIYGSNHLALLYLSNAN